MAWVAPDMSDRISIDEKHRVTNQGLLPGRCAVIRGVWVFLMADNYFRTSSPNTTCTGISPHPMSSNSLTNNSLCATSPSD